MFYSVDFQEFELGAEISLVEPKFSGFYRIVKYSRLNFTTN